MGFLSRRSGGRGTRLLSASSADLSRIGLAAFGGQSVHPPGAAALPIGELDGYAISFLDAAGHPVFESVEWTTARSRFLDELVAAAEVAGDWGCVGAVLVGWNCLTADSREDPRYLAILDRALDVLRLDGVAYMAVPPYVLKRYQRTHGFDGAHPAGWPSTLHNVAVPGPTAEPAVTDLKPGESRRMAQPDPGDESRVIFAERRADGTVVAVIDGIDQDDGVRKRRSRPLLPVSREVARRDANRSSRVWAMRRRLRVAEDSSTPLRPGTSVAGRILQAPDGPAVRPGDWVRSAWRLLREARAVTGLAIVPELLDVRDLDFVLDVADMIQTGARSMNNPGLLKAVGQTDRPVLIKRSTRATDRADAISSPSCRRRPPPSARTA